MLTSVNTPAIISLDAEGRVRMRFTNVRNDELSVVIRAKPISPQRLSASFARNPRNITLRGSPSGMTGPAIDAWGRRGACDPLAR